ncbi:MAG: AGE family epimerase/isomerase [Ginsengibacter sp.]
MLPLTILENYKSELENELSNILGYWQKNAIDKEFGGFCGKLDNSNKVFTEAPKGSVLNSRILWTFSAAYNLNGNEDYLHVAERAFQYIVSHFIDKVNGGIYWSVDYKGNPLDTKKQIYALSFAIYGLSEFYLAAKNETAKELAIQLYHLIVEHSYDAENGGYIEALTADWKEIKDLRLSEKDANEKKSMNTHLHVLEGFANLYRVWPHEELKQKIEELIQIFLDHIIDPTTNHLVLFFDDEWNVKSNIISYGHDIEAAWLVLEAAEIIADGQIIEKVKQYSVLIADASVEGLDKDGGLWYEYDANANHLIKEKHWWPQAEAMIGFFNAWQMTGQKNYLEKSLNSWKFVQQYILDSKNGEWLWGVNEKYEVMNEDKVGLWKCPYHNGRACIELITRINKIVT